MPVGKMLCYSNVAFRIGCYSLAPWRGEFRVAVVVMGSDPLLTVSIHKRIVEP